MLQLLLRIARAETQRKIRKKKNTSKQVGMVKMVLYKMVLYYSAPRGGGGGGLQPPQPDPATSTVDTLNTLHIIDCTQKCENVSKLHKKRKEKSA